MNVLIATGGTAGHIDPALALADTLMKEDSNNHVAFFGSNNRMESTMIPEAGYPFFGEDVVATGKSFSSRASSIFSILKAKKACKKLIQQEKPDICVGFGNYISVPLILAAHECHIPTMIHEQNYSAGKANKLLANVANGIVCCYQHCLASFPKEKTRVLGNPQASIVASYTKDDALCKQYGLDPKKPIVVIMMGSLGSETVSKVLDDSMKEWDSSYQVLLASGKSNPYEFQTKANQIHIVPYIEGGKMLASCDFAITRAGATTVSELAAIGCPSILIPSPFVANNEQVYNAEELVNAKGAILMEEKDLNAHDLATCLNECMADPNRLNTMRKNAKSVGKSQAAQEMISWMKELLGDGRNV